MNTGESDLLTLIAQMSPSLDDQIWAFVSVGEVSSEYFAGHVLATFQETEGMTLIVPWQRAEEFDVCSAPMARITLNIHSSFFASASHMASTVGVPLATHQSLSVGPPPA